MSTVNTSALQPETLSLGQERDHERSIANHVELEPKWLRGCACHFRKRANGQCRQTKRDAGRSPPRAMPAALRAVRSDLRARWARGSQASTDSARITSSRYQCLTHREAHAGAMPRVQDPQCSSQRNLLVRTPVNVLKEEMRQPAFRQSAVIQ